MGNAFPSTSGKRWRALGYESSITSTSANVSATLYPSLTSPSPDLQKKRTSRAGTASAAHRPSRRAENTGGKKKKPNNNARFSREKNKIFKKGGRKRKKKEIKLPVAAMPRRRRRQRGGRRRPCLPIPALRTETKQRINCDADGRL